LKEGGRGEASEFKVVREHELRRRLDRGPDRARAVERTQKTKRRKKRERWRKGSA